MARCCSPCDEAPRGHGSVVGISAGQPSKNESEGREFESPDAPRFMSNMLAPRDLSICKTWQQSKPM